jgi:hypothetical protein
VSYTSGLDVAARGSLLLNHKIFMSVGHDEYWSASQRANVQAASPPVSIWRSSAGTRCSGRPGGRPASPSRAHGRTRGSARQPMAASRRTTLTGQLFDVNAGTTDIQVPAQDSRLRFWRNTAVASLQAGQSIRLRHRGRRRAGTRHVRRRLARRNMGCRRIRGML